MLQVDKTLCIFSLGGVTGNKSMFRHTCHTLFWNVFSFFLVFFSFLFSLLRTPCPETPLKRWPANNLTQASDVSLPAVFNPAALCSDCWPLWLSAAPEGLGVVGVKEGGEEGGCRLLICIVATCLFCVIAQLPADPLCSCTWGRVGPLAGGVAGWDLVLWSVRTADVNCHAIFSCGCFIFVSEKK